LSARLCQGSAPAYRGRQPAPDRVRQQNPSDLPLCAPLLIAGCAQFAGADVGKPVRNEQPGMTIRQRQLGGRPARVVPARPRLHQPAPEPALSAAFAPVGLPGELGRVAQAQTVQRFCTNPARATRRRHPAAGLRPAQSGQARPPPSASTGRSTARGPAGWPTPPACGALTSGS